tara:strand:+ start:1057 stop:1560 length:504 start_codon:yes stop_codon:yes gene_type:complete
MASGFITGFPRSRTRWMADYFDGIHGVTAYHEPLNGLSSKDQFYKIVDTGCIISDSGLFITDFQERYSGIPTLIIERDIDDVYQSLCVYFDEQGLPEPSMEYLVIQQEELSKMSGWRVSFDDIDEKLPEINEYFNVPYNDDYAQMMIAQNLQIPVLTVTPKSFRVWV